MSIKKIAKKVLGKSGVRALKKINQQRKYAQICFNHKNNFIESKYPYQFFELDNKHVFFGYYDLQQLDSDEQKLLVNVLPVGAESGKTPAELFWITRETGEFHRISSTIAWCWQQGSRLRWHPLNKDQVVFNTVEGSNYCAKIYDIIANKCVGTIPCAIYDFTPDFKYGLSLNYSRLQRLRPGYGYSALPDETESMNAPEDDGIFLVDIESGIKTMLFSLKNLAEQVESKPCEEHYINHISVSPNGKRFMFFHLWTKGSTEPWKNRLCVSDINGANMICLEEDGVVSHYCWIDDNTLLTTWVKGGYYIYDIARGKKTHLDVSQLANDGHPSCLDHNQFISDTYPLKQSLQHLFMSSIDGTNYQEIAEMVSDPRQYDEKRCDLHPRLSASKRYVTCDSTFKDGKRSILLFDIGGLN